MNVGDGTYVESLSETTRSSLNRVTLSSKPGTIESWKASTKYHVEHAILSPEPSIIRSFLQFVETISSCNMSYIASV